MPESQQALCELVDMILNASHRRVKEIANQTNPVRGRAHQGAKSQMCHGLQQKRLSRQYGRETDSASQQGNLRKLIKGSILPIRGVRRRSY